MSPLKIKLQQVTDELTERFEDRLRLQAESFEAQLAIRKEASAKQARLIASLIEENTRLVREHEDLDEALDKV